MNSSASRFGILARNRECVALLTVFALSAGASAAQPVAQQPRTPGCAESVPALYSEISPAVLSIAAISANP